MPNAAVHHAGAMVKRLVLLSVTPKSWLTLPKPRKGMRNSKRGCETTKLQNNKSVKGRDVSIWTPWWMPYIVSRVWRYIIHKAVSRINSIHIAINYNTTIRYQIDYESLPEICYGLKYRNKRVHYCVFYNICWGYNYDCVSDCWNADHIFCVIDTVLTEWRFKHFPGCV